MILLSLAILLLNVLGKGVSNIHGASCLYVASNFTAFPFDCEMPDLAYKCRCQDPSFLGTVMSCIDEYAADARDLSLGVIQLIDTCKAQGGIEWEFIGLTEVFANATNYMIEFDTVSEMKYKARWVLQAKKAKSKLQHGMMKGGKIVGVDKEVQEIGIDKVLNETRAVLRYPVTIPKDLYDRSYKSVVNLVSQRKMATQYGLYLYIYWGIVLLVASVSNVIQWCSPKINNQISSGKLSLWIKRKIICPQIIKPTSVIKSPPAVYKNKFLKTWHESFSTAVYTLPLRVHALVLVGYIILMVILCSINYEIVTPNTVFTCPRGQTYVAIADRTGIIGTIQLPLIFLFFTRNNILTNATGLSYRTFQIFHKWVARATFILLVLHCCFYLMFVNVKGDYIDRWGLLKWRCANASFCAIVTTFGITFFRSFGYEFFKLSHKVCLVIFAVGAWYHCITLGWTEYLIVAYVIWGMEYIMRFGKIISTGGLLRGQCTLLKDPAGNPHSIRMLVNHSGWWKPFPGCYCWVYVMKGDMFWQAHPFTVVSATNAVNYNQLVFSIRVKNGATKTLATHIGDAGDIKVLIEGPYGNNVPFKQYDETVLVAGGVGMAVIYSMAMDLANINRARRIRGQVDNDNKISIIWVVPNLESMFAFNKEIETFKEYSDILHVEIFVSRKLEGWDLQEEVEISGILNIEEDESLSYNDDTLELNVSESDILEAFEHNISTSSSIEVITREEQKDALTGGDCNGDGVERVVDHEGEVNCQKQEFKEFLNSLINETKLGGSFHVNFQDKPRLEEEMHAYLNSIQSSPTALISCGPTHMNAAVRVAVARCLKDGKCVDYFEEELLW